MKRYINPEETKLKRTLRYGLGGVSVILWLLFCWWAGWGWICLLPLIIDYFFTKYINWAWGRNHPNPLLRMLISFAGDILYVVVAVTFIFTYFFQNFAIPTSSLEKTLLTGDYLFVTKHKYGPRVPMTPLALPLVHNRFLDGESYSTTPLLPYRRLAGTGQVERNDLVVFNFPAGDTVAVKMPNPDYQILCLLYGRERVHQEKAVFGDIVYRPVDRRDHYVKRCIGLPGETLQIVDGQVHIDGKPIANPSKLQFNYFVYTKRNGLSRELLDKLEINYRDVSERLDSLGNPLYEMPLTQSMKQALEAEPWVEAVVRVPRQAEHEIVYPINYPQGWTVDNYGPILIPKRGLTVPLNATTYKYFERPIRAYEGHKLEMSEDGGIYLDGKLATQYTFAMDYYFMLGDNRHNSADSRVWGFVPEDHIVGQPALLWLSINDEQEGWFSGRIRWNRMMRLIKGD